MILLKVLHEAIAYSVDHDTIDIIRLDAPQMRKTPNQKSLPASSEILPASARTLVVLLEPFLLQDNVWCSL